MSDKMVRVTVRPDCDFCQRDGFGMPAQYDARTQLGRWAYMCRTHYGLHGVGLGLGKGQRIIVESEGADCDCAFTPGDSSHEWHCSTRLLKEEE